MTPSSTARRHEATDIRVRNVLWTAAFFVGVMILANVIVWGLLFWFHGSISSSPLRGNSVPALPEALRDYRVPTSAELRRRQGQALERYGWVDREHGIARIPIERAIDLYVQQQAQKQRGSGK